MRISVVKETAEFEKRVALTPDLVKRLCDAGHEVTVEKNAGADAGFLDDVYKSAGAKIGKSFADTAKGASVVLKVGPLEDKQVAALSENTVVIAIQKPYGSKALFEKIAAQNATGFPGSSAAPYKLLPAISIKLSKKNINNVLHDSFL